MGWGRRGLATTGDLRAWDAKLLKSGKLRKESYSSVKPTPKSQTTMIRGRASGRRNTHVSRYRTDYLEQIETKSEGDQAKSAPKYMRNQMANLSAMDPCGTQARVKHCRISICTRKSFEKYRALVVVFGIQTEDNPNHSHENSRQTTGISTGILVEPKWNHENSRGTTLSPREFSWLQKFVV